MSAKTEPKTVEMIFGSGDNAITVSVAEAKADRLGPQFSKPGAAGKSSGDESYDLIAMMKASDAETARRNEASDDDDGYEAMKVADLHAEIDRRNEGRDEADLIPGDGKKADLVAALEADD